MRLASQQHQHEARNPHHEAGIKTTSARGWHHNNISKKLEIFSTRLESQQHQYKVVNIQH
jgi:hypothetical protein